MRYLGDILEGVIKARGCVAAFAARFCDPYLSAPDVRSKQGALGGPWLDSGINALSIISSFISVETLMVERTVFTRSGAMPLSELAATTWFQGGEARGAIHAQWTAADRSKVTDIYFSDPELSLRVDHAREAIYRRMRPGEYELLLDCRTQHDRLVNHYIGMFDDCARLVAASTSNIDLALVLHKLLFSAVTSSAA
jgi:hypothetical protein